MWLAVTLTGAPLAQAQDHDETVGETDLGALSLEQLGQVQVTSVSRTAQSVGEAPAAVFVVTADDIDRAGVRTFAGALRLAPNLHVARMDGANYAIAARGFNHQSGTSNKLLVLMDGRIVYTPLFSGVFWDEQHALMEDLDRIEVVSGPGGALWGSNAVNGVINIVSRDARETQGWLASGGVSDATRSLGVRYGGGLGEAGAFRIYGLGLVRSVDAPGEWTNGQAGFRADWFNARDAATVQGDVYHGHQNQLTGAVDDTRISGANLLARWTRRLEGGAELVVQSYIDRTDREVATGIRAEVDAAALDAQLHLPGGVGRHDLIIGAGARATRDVFTPGPGTVFLDPAERTLETYNIYLQDTVTLTDRLDLVAGLKLEDNAYTGLEYMPSVRVAWRLGASSLMWGAISRAVRTPSRADHDLINPGLLAGGPHFASETLVAYEIGYRAQANERLWYSASGYYNAYEDLRTLEATTPFVFPLEIRNGMRGETYGVEAWGGYAVREGWRVHAGLNWQQKNLRLDGESQDVFGVSYAGNDPEWQISMRSLIDLTTRAQFDVTTRYVSALNDPAVKDYVALDARFGFQLSDDLELSLTGYNLLDGDGRAEFINPSLPPFQVERSFFISARWRS